MNMLTSTSMAEKGDFLGPSFPGSPNSRKSKGRTVKGFSCKTIGQSRNYILFASSLQWGVCSSKRLVARQMQITCFLVLQRIYDGWMDRRRSSNKMYGSAKRMLCVDDAARSPAVVGQWQYRLKGLVPWRRHYCTYSRCWVPLMVRTSVIGLKLGKWVLTTGT